MAEGSGCGKCKRVHERVAQILPFVVTEKITDKPLRIRGLAMTAGLSRNLNLYTPEELEAFSGKLKDAPVYLEHVNVNDAVGKVTKTAWDGQNLLYEAEIYDEETAEKIRKGLIRHVSVGADYDTVDVTDGGKVPHGLHNAEMSLVAVPGIPETNIQVIEHLRESLAKNKAFHLTSQMREILEPLGPEFLQCVFCGKPGEYVVSICTQCGDNAQSMIVPAGSDIHGNEGEKLNKEEMQKIVQDGVQEGLRKAGITEAEWDTQYIDNLPDDAFAYIEDGGQKDDQGKTIPRSLRHLPYKNAEGKLDADQVRNGLARLDQTAISAEAKKAAMKKLCSAAGELKIESSICNLDNTAENMKTQLAEAQKKVTETENKLKEANQNIEQLKQLVPGVDLLKKPQKLMPISEAVKLVEQVLPSPMVQRSWSLGPQRMCQDLQKTIQQLKHTAGEP